MQKIEYFSCTLPEISWKQLEKITKHPSKWRSFLSRLRQPEANASIGQHVGLLVAPVKSKDRAQAKVMTDYKEDQAAGNLAKFQKCTEILEIFQRILKKLKDISSIISTRKHAGFNQKNQSVQVEIMGSLLFVFETLINS